MKPFTCYDTPTVSFPDQASFTTVYVYSRGRVLWQGTVNEWKSAREMLVAESYVQEHVVDTDALQAARSAWYADKRRLNEEFENDLFAEYGLSPENKKAQRCFEMANQRGGTKAQIAEVFAELVELIID